jgi:Asp-tRNA(Asn)/Glu-tRNA(Gln) amidotransferase A subunit family amidase
MKKLKSLFEILGFKNVSTYINSGNIIFETGSKPKREEIEAAMEKEFGFAIQTLVKTKREMQKIATAVPNDWQNDAEQRTDVAYLFPEIDLESTLNELPVKKEFIDVLSEVDVILAPCSPTTAWKIGDKCDNPLEMYLADIYTVCINVAGVPSLALPCGFDSQKLPIGFQLIGNFFEESKILSVGHQYQQFTSFHTEVPQL